MDNSCVSPSLCICLRSSTACAAPLVFPASLFLPIDILCREWYKRLLNTRRCIARLENRSTTCRYLGRQVTGGMVALTTTKLVVFPRTRCSHFFSHSKPSDRLTNESFDQRSDGMLRQNRRDFLPRLYRSILSGTEATWYVRWVDRNRGVRFSESRSSNRLPIVDVRMGAAAASGE